MSSITLRPKFAHAGEWLNAGGVSGFDTKHWDQTALVGGDDALGDGSDATYAYIAMGGPAFAGAPYYGLRQDAVGGYLDALTLDPATVTDLVVRVRYKFPSVANEGALSGNGHGIGVYAYDASADTLIQIYGQDATSTPPSVTDTIIDRSISYRQLALDTGVDFATVAASYVAPFAADSMSLLVIGGAVVASEADFGANYPNFTQIFEVSLTFTDEVASSDMGDPRQSFLRGR